MKKSFTIVLLLLSFIVGFAQNKPKFNLDEHRKALREYVMQRVDLLEDEADKFFPLYFEMREQERSIFKIGKDLKFADKYTDEDFQKAFLMFDSLQIDLKRNQALYHQKMLDVVPVKKLVLVLTECENYNKEVFMKISSQHKPDGNKSHKKPGLSAPGFKEGDSEERK